MWTDFSQKKLMFLPNVVVIAEQIIMYVHTVKNWGYFISMFPNIPKYYGYQLDKMVL